MVQSLTGKLSSPVRAGILLIVLAVLVWASPSEETIGDLVKVVYLHGAFVRVAELVFAASGILGLFYLLRKNDSCLRWSWALQKAAFLFWVVSFLLSIYVMQKAWGGINWVEPRFLATARVLAIAIVAIAVAYLTERPKIIAATGVVMGAIVVIEIATAGLMLHPANPIGTSPSLLTKGYYYGIMLVIFALAFEATLLLLPNRAEKDVSVQAQ